MTQLPSLGYFEYLPPTPRARAAAFCSLQQPLPATISLFRNPHRAPSTVAKMLLLLLLPPPPLGHVNDTAQASAMVQFFKRLGAFWGTRRRREGGARGARRGRKGGKAPTSECVLAKMHTDRQDALVCRDTCVPSALGGCNVICTELVRVWRMCTLYTHKLAHTYKHTLFCVCASQ